MKPSGPYVFLFAFSSGSMDEDDGLVAGWLDNKQGSCCCSPEAARSAAPTEFAPVCGFYVQFFTLIANVTLADLIGSSLLLLLGRHSRGQRVMCFTFQIGRFLSVRNCSRWMSRAVQWGSREKGRILMNIIGQRHAGVLGVSNHVKDIRCDCETCQVVSRMAVFEKILQRFSEHNLGMIAIGFLFFLHKIFLFHFWLTHTHL